jgi:hypothetical protein
LTTAVDILDESFGSGKASRFGNLDQRGQGVNLTFGLNFFLPQGLHFCVELSGIGFNLAKTLFNLIALLLETFYINRHFGTSIMVRTRTRASRQRRPPGRRHLSGYNAVSSGVFRLVKPLIGKAGQTLGGVILDFRQGGTTRTNGNCDGVTLGDNR